MGIDLSRLMGFEQQHQIQQHLAQQTGAAAAQRILHPRVELPSTTHLTGGLPDTTKMNDMDRGMHAYRTPEPLRDTLPKVDLKPAQFVNTHKMNDWDRGLHVIKPLIGDGLGSKPGYGLGGKKY